MRPLFWLLISLVTAPALGVRQSVPCTAVDFFRSDWPSLIVLEPRLQSFIDRTAALPGAPITNGRLVSTNCHVETEVDESGKSVSNERGVEFDVEWFTNEAKLHYHAGFKAQYLIKASGIDSITGIAFCGSLEACNYLGIPFTKKPGTEVKTNVAGLDGSPAVPKR